MLRAAQSGDWRQFEKLKNDCAQLIAQQRVRAASVKLAPDQQRLRLAALLFSSAIAVPKQTVRTAMSQKER